MESLIYFLLLAVLFVGMMRFGCGAHIMGHGHRHGRPDDKEPSARGQPPRRPAAREKDPVCGMMVDTASAKASVQAGQAYYFCSTDCRDKFEASPQTYVRNLAVPSQPKEHQHGSHC